MRCRVQLFGCVDWAPSDLIATFLLAGMAQTCRRRSKVELIAAAGGVPEMPARHSPSRDGTAVCSTVWLHIVSILLLFSYILHLGDFPGILLNT